MQQSLGRTASGHTRAILASKVTGTAVYNAAGESVGHVEDVVLDKTSDRIMFAVVGFGGFLGIGEKYHPLPWAQLDFDEMLGGYRIALSREQLEAAPSYEMDDLTRADGDAQERAQSYYAALGQVQTGAGI